MISYKGIDSNYFEEYDSIPMRVYVNSHYELDKINNGLGGILLKEVPVKNYVRDFSKHAKATKFSEKFDITNWTFFMAFDDEKCIDCLSFPLNEIRQLKLSKGDIVDQNLKGGAAGAEKLLFSYKGIDHTFYYYKQINYLPDQNRPTNDDYSKIYISVVEPFTEKIASLNG